MRVLEGMLVVNLGGGMESIWFFFKEGEEGEEGVGVKRKDEGWVEEEEERMEEEMIEEGEMKEEEKEEEEESSGGRSK